jgi:hypothetical protein
MVGGLDGGGSGGVVNPYLKLLAVLGVVEDEVI